MSAAAAAAPATAALTDAVADTTAEEALLEDADDGPPLTGIARQAYLAQYFAVGLVYGGLPATTYGFFLGYLNVPSYVYSACGTVITLPWSFKFFLGALNDCVPIAGYRRKPYMALGWAICCAMLVALSQLKLPPR